MREWTLKATFELAVFEGRATSQAFLDGIVKGKGSETKEARNSPRQGRRCEVNTITVHPVVYVI
jgi:hypothetical protein